MKKQIFSLAAIALALFIFLGILNAQEQNSTIKEAKIKTTAECEMCKERIEKNVNKLEGIKSSNLDVPSKVFTVKYDEKEVDLDKIRNTISKLGYDADEVKANVKAYKKLPKCCQIGGHK
jgi:copper chaperone CopZ